jgi:hypothetical protein
MYQGGRMIEIDYREYNLTFYSKDDPSKKYKGRRCDNYTYSLYEETEGTNKERFKIKSKVLYENFIADKNNRRTRGLRICKRKTA